MHRLVRPRRPAAAPGRRLARHVGHDQVQDDQVVVAWSSACCRRLRCRWLAKSVTYPAATSALPDERHGYRVRRRPRGSWRGSRPLGAAQVARAGACVVIAVWGNMDVYRSPRFVDSANSGGSTLLGLDLNLVTARVSPPAADRARDLRGGQAHSLAVGAHPLRARVTQSIAILALASGPACALGFVSWTPRQTGHLAAAPYRPRRWLAAAAARARRRRAWCRRWTVLARRYLFVEASPVLRIRPGRPGA